jgi:hypothetical protein
MGHSPGEFWRTDPLHFWWLVEAKAGEAEKRGGGLDAATRNELLAMMAEAEAQERWQSTLQM